MVSTAVCVQMLELDWRCTHLLRTWTNSFTCPGASFFPSSIGSRFWSSPSSSPNCSSETSKLSEIWLQRWYSSTNRTKDEADFGWCRSLDPSYEFRSAQNGWQVLGQIKRGWSVNNAAEWNTWFGSGGNHRATKCTMLAKVLRKGIAFSLWQKSNALNTWKKKTREMWCNFWE